MGKERQSAAAVSMGTVSTSPKLGATLLRVAWLSILLGFVMEAVKLLSAAGVGIFPGLDLTVVADLVGQVSWSTIVCVGLAIGTAVSKFRASLMGVFGPALRSSCLRCFSFPSPGRVSVARHLGDRFWPWPVPVHTRYPQGG